MMGFALVARRKSPRSRLNSAYAPAPSKAVRGPLGVKRASGKRAKQQRMSASAPIPDISMRSSETSRCAKSRHSALQQENTSTICL